MSTDGLVSLPDSSEETRSVFKRRADTAVFFGRIFFVLGLASALGAIALFFLAGPVTKSDIDLVKGSEVRTQVATTLRGIYKSFWSDLIAVVEQGSEGASDTDLKTYKFVLEGFAKERDQLEQVTESEFPGYDLGDKAQRIVAEAQAVFSGPMPDGLIADLLRFQADARVALVDENKQYLGKLLSKPVVGATTSGNESNWKLEQFGVVFFLTLNRFGVVVVALFLTVTFFAFYRYNSRLAAFYYARDDALRLVGNPAERRRSISAAETSAAFRATCSA